MIEDATVEASEMSVRDYRPSPRKTKMAEQFEREGFVLEDTDYHYLAAKGDQFDLRRVLARVDRAYFGADRPFDLPRVAWGDLDAHNAWALYVVRDDVIVVEKALDSEATPSFVLDYLLLHELLHLANPPKEGGDQDDWHTESFEAGVEAFPRAEEAEAWLDKRAMDEHRARRGGARGAFAVG